MAYIDPEDKNIVYTPEDLRQAYDFDSQATALIQTGEQLEDLEGTTIEQYQIISENFVDVNESIDSVNTIVGENTTILTAQGEQIVSNVSSISELEQTVNGLEFTQSKMGGSNLLDNSAKIYGTDKDGWTYSVGYDGVTVVDTTNTSNSGRIQYLGNGYEQVEQEEANNLVTVSFYYKQISGTSIASVNINDNGDETLGTETEWTLYYKSITIENGQIKVKFTCDETSGYYYRDLMINLGDLPFPWAQSLNETFTDTVRIGGAAVEVISTGSETTTKMSAESGFEILDKNTELQIANFDKDGLNTKDLKASNKVTINKLRIQAFDDGYAFTIND